MIPEKVKILGYTYDVILKRNIDKELIVHNNACVGSVHHIIRKIYLHNPEGISEETLLQAMWHEIIHIIEYHFDSSNEKTNLSEGQIDMIATGIASAIIATERKDDK